MFHVLCIEAVPEGEIGRKNLDPHQVVPAHASLIKHRGESGKQKFEFFFHLGRNYAGCGIDADAAGDVKRAIDEYGIAEWQVGGPVWEMDVAAGTSGTRGHKE